MSVSKNQLKDELSTIGDLSLRQGVHGRELSTFAIGGELLGLIEVESISALQQAILMLKQAGEVYRVLGFGSNLLISDEGVSDWVIKLGSAFNYCKETGSGSFDVGGASSFAALSKRLSAKGFSGLEFAGGIPASVGGAIRMNAGAHGGQIADLLEELSFVDRSGELIKLSSSELNFSYRKSSIPGEAVVVGLKLKLTASDAVKTAKKRAAFLAERKQRQPLGLPSAGSVFKNPLPDKAAGMLIDRAGLKGASVGSVKISELHGNWIINQNRKGTAIEVKELMMLCQNKVSELFKLELEPEVIFW